MAIVRITTGEVGMALHNGEPAILEPGRHILREPEWKYVGSQVSEIYAATQLAPHV